MYMKSCIKFQNVLIPMFERNIMYYTLFRYSLFLLQISTCMYLYFHEPSQVMVRTTITCVVYKCSSVRLVMAPDHAAW